MGKKAPKAPTPPDPIKTAEAQGAANAEVARVNQAGSMVDQYTPYGSLIYTPIGGDRYRADVQLSPQQADLENRNYLMDRDMLHYAQEQLGRVGNVLASPMDTSRLPGYAPVRNLTTAQNVVDFAGAPQAKDTQYYADQLMQRQAPQFQRQRDDLRTQMINQGIREGTEAWQRGMDDFNRGQNDAQLAAQLAAGQEQSRQYGISSDQAAYQNNLRGMQLGEHERAYQAQLTADNYQNQLRQAQLQEQAYLRQLPINEISALMSGAQVQGPSFVNTPAYNQAQTPLAESVYGSYQGQLNNYNTAMQSRASMTQGLMGLIGAGAKAGAMYFSDIRLKNKIAFIGFWKGHKVYSYRYIWGGPRHIGVMAQEVRRYKPEAVHEVDGFLAVDYGAL